MLLEIDEQSEQPIYQQLIDQIIVGIAKGELVPNESLPSIRQLADEIGVNMMTVSKAYNKLKQSGYIVTDRRNGTKIAAKLPATAVWQQQLHERLELLLAESFYISNPKQKSKHLFRKFIKILIRKGVHYNGGILLFHPSFCRFFYGIYYGDLCKSSQKYYFGKHFTRR